MKVYVTYKVGGYADLSESVKDVFDFNDTEVNKIFASWDAAIEYRIKQYEHLKDFGWTYEKIKNHVMSEPCIDEFEVEGE
jgi:hypothetical protein